LAAISPTPGGPENIPFYRNVKIIGVLAQIVFVIVILVGVGILVRNVVSALQASNLPADFSFLDNRAGIPIAESAIRYEPDNSYARAFTVAALNTLKVALVGVVLASLMGILIGVMRLSGNWLLRQLATGYVETIRNTPLAVQIVFWFTAVLTPLPPRIQNPIELPGGALFSNQGFAFPWLYPSYRFGAWVPWLIAALVVLVVLYAIRRRQIIASERPGNPWTLSVAASVIVLVAGYLVTLAGNSLPQGLAADFFQDRGRGTAYLDADGDATFDPEEDFVPFASLNLAIDEAQIGVTSQNLTESRGVADGTFRFPLIRRSEVDSLEIAFADPDGADGLSFHLVNEPNVGQVYRDLDGDGAFDRGEEIDPERDDGRGYSGIDLTMTVTGFERRVIADRNGGFRIPIFDPVGGPEEADAGDGDGGGGGGGGALGGLFGSPTAGDEPAVETTITFAQQAPLSWSVPTVPVSNYFGGVRLTTSFLALLLALVVYTASFIAEIVRAGIQAVAKGQREAAQALGLSGFQTFTLIVFPQALRIILPPMISQYLNLTKNSSLAPLAGYAELFVISSIIANQTGASIPMALLLIASYLVISMVFALVLNGVNERLKLVER
jgi:general L-amino acid transport system permease protein